ncbi:hypothetical protein GN958_ATG12732 [Phytophthora infestans]|uniref:OTU domain-containing protein n=1 Tax=Phytophthora infestans TaxID=4787 RepID=A0A8S9UC88_PHYIN|nr:hypothetical protein GN958_ATG12732 [Phytophthora infestans]
MGMFSVLADSDSEADEGVNAMQVDEDGLDQSCPLTPEQEEAPYAYPQEEDEETKDDRVPGFEEEEQAQTIVQRTGSVDDVAMTQVTDDEDGTAEHRTTPAEENAGTEEDIKPSKALEAQSATAVVRVARKAKQQLGKTFEVRATTAEYPAPPRIKAAAPASLTEEVVPATPDSQEKMTMGPTRTGTDAGDSDLPIQVGQWLASFDGTMVEVEANGQCALLALYASTVNHPAAKLKTTKAVVREATSFKDSFYALMMSNIRKDVALGLVDPIAEYAKLYPDHPAYTSTEAATAAIYGHYNQARTRREPIVVFDTNASLDAHVQRYSYKTHRLADNTDHETGHVEPLPDRTARDYLYACWSLHVLPFFLVLRHDQSHLYGVSHGELFLKWRTEGDESFAKDLPDSYRWKEDINSLKDTERSVDLTTINHLADVTEVNKLLIKRLEMRTRLDFVHARQGLAILNVDPLPSDLKDVLHIEEQHIHEAYGMDTYAASSQEDQSGGHQGSSLPQRYAKAASGDIIANTYFRILRQSNSVAKEEVDGPLEDLIALSNQEAFIKWRDLFKEELSLPKMKRRKVTSADIQEWLLAHLEALRHFFAFISFLEYEAKTRWSQDHLLQWGVMETYVEQVAALNRLANDDSIDDSTREFCTKWHAECTNQAIKQSQRRQAANDPDKWGQLAQRIPSRYCRAQPTHISTEAWHILHILPHVVCDWADTPMGRASLGARSTWYEEFPFVRQLCHGVVEFQDWSAASLAPTGHTWKERRDRSLGDSHPTYRN